MLKRVAISRGSVISSSPSFTLGGGGAIYIVFTLFNNSCIVILFRVSNHLDYFVMPYFVVLNVLNSV